MCDRSGIVKTKKNPDNYDLPPTNLPYVPSYNAQRRKLIKRDCIVVPKEGDRVGRVRSRDQSIIHISLHREASANL
jgi:hypothetical protein